MLCFKLYLHYYSYKNTLKEIIPGDDVTWGTELSKIPLTKDKIRHSNDEYKKEWSGNYILWGKAKMGGIANKKAPCKDIPTSRVGECSVGLFNLPPLDFYYKLGYPVVDSGKNRDLTNEFTPVIINSFEPKKDEIYFLKESEKIKSREIFNIGFRRDESAVAFPNKVSR